MRNLILIPPSEGKNSGGTNNPVSFSEVSKSLLSILDTSKVENKNILSQKTLPAIERYSGVVYKGIDYESLKNKRLFDEHVRIISGLFGVIKPTDLIPNYKLKMNRTYKVWREHILFDDSYFIYDLLPQEHKKAVSYTKGVRIEFSIIKNGKKIPAGHNGKLIKGKFIRWLTEHNFSDFAQFKEDGFSWDNSERQFIKTI